ncbi:hypothetical protein GCM10008967_08800 [Bacillus carboniphilus]|uniref:YhfC family intramembrane metalloprotease n=1 Tax=Bacillus carboniphilus TaxID=86663 RepID=A0ABN0VYG8_9BACI
MSQLTNIPAGEQLKKQTNLFYLCIPLYILVPILFVFVFYRFGQPFHLGAFAIGILGWVIALFLRGPIALVAHHFLSEKKASTLVVLSSGPLEEIVRFIVLAITVSTFSYSLSIGQGWAAIEVLYAIVSGFMTLQVLRGTDEKAQQAKEILEKQGMNMNINPLLGVWERIFASGFHIGATLLIAHSTWLLFILIPLHSLLNLSVVYLMKRSMAYAQILVTAVGTLALLAGWLIWG